MYQIVLDTNILVAALRSSRGASHRILRLVGEGLFRINISVALALEYEEVLKRPGLIPELTAPEIDGFLDYLFRAANLVDSVETLGPSLSDPDDELVLDLAIECGAMIVTYNKSDFAGAAKQGVKVAAPGEFLNLLSQ